MDHCLTWLGMHAVACASGALWWPEARLLCVSDLHLGRSERVARRGFGLLPPYDAADTIDRLAAEIGRWRPATVVCLGDSFDDPACEAGLGWAERHRLGALMKGRDWVWIAGNHDPGGVALGGRHLAQLALGMLRFRHVPERAAEPGEVAGHLHPKFCRRLGGQAISRPCFIFDARRIILPAFGTYTGGLSVDDPAVTSLLDLGTARAVLTGAPCVAVPIAGDVPAGRRRA